MAAAALLRGARAGARTAADFVPRPVPDASFAVHPCGFCGDEGTPTALRRRLQTRASMHALLHRGTHIRDLRAPHLSESRGSSTISRACADWQVLQQREAPEDFASSACGGVDAFDKFVPWILKADSRYFRAISVSVQYAMQMCAIRNFAGTTRWCYHCH